MTYKKIIQADAARMLRVSTTRITQLLDSKKLTAAKDALAGRVVVCDKLFEERLKKVQGVKE